MNSVETQLVVLGAGPGGYAAAFLAADRGMKVTLIDVAARPGGVCLHRGCIPSKALLHAAHVIDAVKDSGDWGLTYAPPRIDLAVLRSKKEKIIDQLSGHLAELCKRRNVAYIQGRATLTGPDRLQVEGGAEVRFEHAILATGSSPTKLPMFDIGSPKIVDSTGALALEDMPPTLLVVGGGYIGLEMATVYAALGSQVTVVELTDSLLPGVDADLVKPLANRLKSHLHRVYLNTKVTGVAVAGDNIKANFEGESPEKEALFAKVLVAIGRRPNSANLGLDKAGVQLDPKGFIQVDGQRRTTNEKIYAIGDVAGEPMLAHKAAHEGKLAVQVILGGKMTWEPRAIPAVVFTDPEIAWAGLMETQAKKEGREYKVARFNWAGSGRAATLGRTDGLSKILIDPADDRVIGVGLVGAGAGELISEAVIALEMGATAKDIALSIHPHPTLTETISEAAETLHGLSTHIFVRKAT